MSYPRIYVADLAAYNEGKLVGSWINLEDMDSADDLHEAIKRLVLRDGHEEWAIHDYEGFEGAKVEEYDSLTRVVALAKGIGEHGEAFGQFVSHFGIHPEEAVDQFDDAYIGEMSIKDYAGELADEMLDCAEVPEDSIARRYFDYDMFARDLVIGGDVVEADGHLFHGNW